MRRAEDPFNLIAERKGLAEAGPASAMKTKVDEDWRGAEKGFSLILVLFSSQPFYTAGRLVINLLVNDERTICIS
jgi:hypothetical protein